MSTLALALVGLTLVVGTAAAWLETAGWSGYGIPKMLASTGYLAFALTMGALESAYGVGIFLALLLSWVGDLLLIGQGRSGFLAGLGAFLLAHIAYAATFALDGLLPGPAGLAAGIMIVLAVVVFRWLRSGDMPRGMATPVMAYLVAIGGMVAFAAGTGSPIILAGAVAFAVSDLFVARHRFVTPEPLNRRLGLPLYFAAQLLLASTV